MKKPNVGNPKSFKSNLAKLDRMTDADIDYSDIPALGDEFFTKPTFANAEKSGSTKAGRSILQGAREALAYAERQAQYRSPDHKKGD